MALWGALRIGVESIEPKDAAVGDGEDASLKISEGDFAVAGFLRDVADSLFDAGHGEVVAAADDGDHEALLGGDGDADVVVVVLNDIGPVDDGVDAGDFL